MENGSEFLPDLVRKLKSYNGRMPGWLAQWEEGLLDPEQRIARPRQVYIGPDERPYVSMEDRDHSELDLLEPPHKPIGGD